MRKEANADVQTIAYEDFLDAKLPKEVAMPWMRLMAAVMANMQRHKSFYLTVGRNQKGDSVLLTAKIEGYKPLYCSFVSGVDAPAALEAFVADLMEDL